MKKSEAIKILEKQIDRIHEDHLIRDNNWVQETNTYLKKFFGPNSDQSKKFDENAWDHENGMGEPNETLRIEIATHFLKECIFQIKKFGLHKESKLNFLTTWPDWIVALLFPAIFSIGLTIGKYTSDLQNVELRRENENLKESIPSDTISYKVKNNVRYPKN